MTIHAGWGNVPEGNTTETVLWKCSLCDVEVNFMREGYGEPHASETEYPEDIDSYISVVVCPPVEDFIPVFCDKIVFFNAFTDTEIVAIMDSTDMHVRASVFRFNNTNEVAGIPINHPLLLAGLQYFESIELLGSGRAVEIVTLCTPTS